MQSTMKLPPTQLDKKTVALSAATVAVTVAAVVVVLSLKKASSRFPHKGTFESVSVAGREFDDATTLRLTFTDDGVLVYAGGNDMAGTVMVADGRMFWSEEHSTTAGLPPKRALQDAWLSTWLNAGVDVFRHGKTLVLSRDGVRIELQRVDEPL